MDDLPPTSASGAAAGQDDPRWIDDAESRVAMRAFLQRAEVRLSTVHRVASALLGGAGLLLLLPLFLRDGFPKLTSLVISSYDADRNPLAIIGIAVAAGLSVILPVMAIYLLVGDLLGFYFTSSTFGAPGAGADSTSRRVFNPRFIVPGLGLSADETSPATGVALAEARDDRWTRSLLVPPAGRSSDPDPGAGDADAQWRDRFDTRMHDIWGTTFPEGPVGDAMRVRQQFRLAGLNSDRTLAGEVARTEALLASHVLRIRVVVLRYSKALLVLIATTVATLAASGIIDQGQRPQPHAASDGGLEYRYLFMVALVYVAWAPVAARSVTAPLRLIQRHTPGVGEFRDAYLDKRMTQFESMAVGVTAIGLVAAGTAAMAAGWADGRKGGLLGAAVFVALATAAWLWALRDYAAGIGQTLSAFSLTLRGREAPVPSDEMRARRANSGGRTTTGTGEEEHR